MAGRHAIVKVIHYLWEQEHVQINSLFDTWLFWRKKTQLFRLSSRNIAKILGYEILMIFPRISKRLIAREMTWTSRLICHWTDIISVCPSDRYMMAPREGYHHNFLMRVHNEESLHFDHSMYSYIKSPCYSHTFDAPEHAPPSPTKLSKKYCIPIWLLVSTDLPEWYLYIHWEHISWKSFSDDP